MNVSVFELTSFAVAIISAVLAVVAIVLSIVFYRMSSALSQSTKEAAGGIGASVEKLEKLFDRLYADTFSMMKDTVSDMRKHAWGEAAGETPDILEEAEKKTEEKIEILRNRMDEQIGTILKGQKITDDRIINVSGKLKEVVDKTIEDSRKAEHEVREETIRNYILRYICLHPEKVGRVAYTYAKAIVDSRDNRFSQKDVTNEIRVMKKEGLISFEGDTLAPITKIYLTEAGTTKGHELLANEAHDG